MFFENWFHYLSPQQILDLENFKQFLISYNLITTTVGVLIAYAAWDFIQSLIGDILLPGIYFLFFTNFISNKFISSVFEPVNKLNFPRFITRLLSFSIAVTVTFLFIQYIIRNWINKNNNGTLIIDNKINIPINTNNPNNSSN
jgi:large-conductance mechanosensitive channel